MSMTMGQLADLGLASFEESPLRKVITLGGDYEAENGFWYSVQWINGQPHRSAGGYAAEYRLAQLDDQKRVSRRARSLK